MNRCIRFAAYLAFAAVLPAVHASAAQRTFVASSGSDINMCSLAAPCRSFGTAMTQVDPGGEVVVLDSAGYGPVVIGQSVSIIAPVGVYAGITAFSGVKGILVNGGGVVVTLRGLSVNGLPGSIFGIHFRDGDALHVENCVISGFDTAGISVDGPGTVSIKDTQIRDNGSWGIAVLAIHLPQVVRLTIDQTRVERTGFRGISVRDNARVLVKGTTVTGSGDAGISVDAPVAGDTAEVVVESSAVTHNDTGIHAGTIAGAGNHRVIVSNSTVSWNTTGWNVLNDPGTNLYTRGNNTVRFNGNNQAGKAEIVLTGD